MIDKLLKILEDDIKKSTYIWEIIKNQKANVNKKNNIPKVIIQFWDEADNIPEDVLKCIQTWKKFENKGIQHILFNKRTARNFIVKNYNEKYVEAFDNCFHPALQSDYFRMCYILINGGAYIDADDEAININMNDLFDGNRLKVQALCYDLKKDEMINAKIAYQSKFYNTRIYYVNNNPLVAPPHNPIIEKALEFATKKLQQKPLSSDFQLIAGPGNLVNSIIWNNLSNMDLNQILDITIDWDEKVTSRWPLDYRSDNRNWRNLK